MPSDRPVTLKGLFNITLAESIERIIGFGYDGLLIGGTYGEFATMTPDERAELFRRSIDAARGRVPLMLCAAASDSRTTLDLTQLAVELGGYPMVTPPYVSEVNDEHSFEFFRWIAPGGTGRLVIYNAPGIGITLSPRLIERLTSLDDVLSLKQGDLNATAIDEIANRLGGKIGLFCASDLAFLGPLMAGFDGLSSTNSCAFPELILAIYRAAISGDGQRAIKLHRIWYKYRELARRYGQPQTVKAAMVHRGWSNGVVRSPLLKLAADQDAEIAAVTRDILAAMGSLC
jgi:4-hydroxy-tetrahydrodipicolinate synthase